MKACHSVLGKPDRRVTSGVVPFRDCSKLMDVRCEPGQIQPNVLRLNNLPRTCAVTDWLSLYGTKVPFTLYSYENKVSLDSRQG